MPRLGTKKATSQQKQQQQPDQQQQSQQQPKASLPDDDEYADLCAVQRRLLLASQPQLQRLPAHLQALAPQQSLLYIIQAAFDAVTTDASFPDRRRQIKDLFLKRDFHAIFTDPLLLPVYAAEYIPGRALCYRDMFMRLAQLRRLLKTGGRVLCLGAGNGAEVLGIASAMHGMKRRARRAAKSAGAARASDAAVQRDRSPAAGFAAGSPASDPAAEKAAAKEQTTSSPSSPSPSTPLVVHAQDLSSYGAVIPSLHSAIQATLGLAETDLRVETSVADLVDSAVVDSTVVPLIASAQLVTAMFVLNELLTVSKRGFTGLVTRLIKNLPVGAYLLVVDSAGSFSEVTIAAKQQPKTGTPKDGAEEEQDEEDGGQDDTVAASRTYMVFHLLDSIQALRTCVAYDSIWYRYPQELLFPMKISNMRYFLRLYQKVDPQ